MSSLIDIICSAKNAGPQFEQTVKSVLTQTFHDFRLILIDDGSDDGFTGKIAAATAGLDPRVEVHRNDAPRGLTANLVWAVARSSAKFIARIDAGDMWLPGKLCKQISAIGKDESLIMVGTQCNYVSADGEVLGQSDFAEDDERIRKAFTTGRGIFTHSSILFRRVINYRNEFRYSQDLDLYLRASQFGKLRCMPDVLTLCLIDAGGLTLQRKYLQRKYQALAYRSYSSRLRFGTDMDARTRKRSFFVWGAYLGLALILFPPLLTDYLRRALGIAR